MASANFGPMRNLLELCGGGGKQLQHRRNRNRVRKGQRPDAVNQGLKSLWLFLRWSRSFNRASRSTILHARRANGTGDKWHNGCIFRLRMPGSADRDSRLDAWIAVKRSLPWQLIDQDHRGALDLWGAFAAVLAIAFAPAARLSSVSTPGQLRGFPRAWTSSTQVGARHNNGISELGQAASDAGTKEVKRLARRTFALPKFRFTRRCTAAAGAWVFRAGPGIWRPCAV